MRASNQTPFVAAILCCLLVLSGCMGKQPQTVPLDEAGRQEALSLWETFLSRDTPPAVDADVRVGWDVLGSKGGVAATLIAEQPAFFRFAANDPLGRSLLLAVSDGTSFTLIDNRKGHVSQGTIHSRFWRSYIPRSVRAEDLFSLLGGCVTAGEGADAQPAQDEQARGFWYQWQDDRGLRHHVLLSRYHGEVHQHMLIDGRGEVVLDFQYSDYLQDTKSGYSWPGHLQVTGAAVTGTLTLRVEQIYSYIPKGEAAFHLVAPPHFTVEQIP
ncbi:MAG: hypothetical protein RBQ88_11065 [Desulfobulbus oligotrophicus]|nr:hypothetical protein [Desulfobulbus oligotrophicus]